MGWSWTGYAALLAVFTTAGCSAEQVVDIRYRSEPIKKAVTEIKSFVFEEDAAGDLPSCEELDPRGLGPGDAEERTKRIAFAKSESSPKETLGAIENLVRQKPYTLVIEAWGPRCLHTGQGTADEPSCAQFATDGSLVMRGYTCTALDFETARSETTLDLETFALISASMSVPNLTPPAKAVHYDKDRPLPVVDGIEAIDRFLVQLIDEKSEAANGVKVHWGLISGSGSFDQDTSLTVEDDMIGDGGFSAAVLRAGANASKQPDRKITVYAYAPGYEGSPVMFEAIAVPAVEVELNTFDAPATEIPLFASDSELRPVLVDDLDGNGTGDVVFTTGEVGSCSRDPKHQVVVLYQDDNGAFSARQSPQLSGELRNMITARLDGSGSRSLLTFLSDSCSHLASVDEDIPGIPDPRTYVLEGARIEIFSTLGSTPGGATITETPLVLRNLLKCDGANCVTVPMTQAYNAASTSDFEGDGIDEIAGVRCSYVYFAPRVSGQPEFQSSRVYCHGDLADRSDSQVAVLTAELDGNGAFQGFRERAAIDEEGGDGGFREVALGDINGDQSPDLVFATQTEVGTVCGRRNMPETGYGFGSVPPPPRFDASITFAQGYAVGVGKFDGDDIDDVVVSGGLRAASQNAGVKMNPSRGCAFDPGDDAVIIGPKTFARRMALRVADLNLDGYDDVVVLHRDVHELTTLFGTGTQILARGPRLPLPGGPTSELGLYVEHKGERSQTVVAATVGTNEGHVFVVRFRPGGR